MMKNGAMQKSKQWNVKGAIWLAGVFHFLHSCGSGCLLPFLTLYFRHLGLNATMIGIIMASKHLLALVWRPLSSVLTRQYDKRRTVIVGSLLSSALVVLTLLLFPSTGIQAESGRCNASQPDTDPTTILEWATIPSQSNVTVYSINQTSVSAEQPVEVTTIVSSNWSARGLRSVKKPQQEEDPHTEFLGSLKVMDAQHQMFFLVLIVMGLWEFMAAPLEWTTDDGLYEYLDFVDATDHHNGVKVWKQLGAAFGNCAVGVLVTSLFCLTGTTLEFYSYTTFMILTVPTAALLPIYLRKRERPTSAGFKALQLVRGNSQAILCAVTVILMGMVNSAVSDFLLWHMQDCGATEIHMGISLALAHLSQTGFAPIAGHLSRFLKYHGWLLVLAVVSLALQCLYYSFLWGPWAVIPAQLLAGFSTGALWWSVTSQSEDIATPGTEKTILRLFEALSLELGAAFGSLTAGFVVQKFGVQVLFQGTAVILALWSSALAVLKWKIPRQRRINYSRLLAADTEMSESESDQEKDWLETAMEDATGNNKWTIDKS
ncbi:major facilitator superfamily domain-containing protein 6-like [Sinocyclocheilus rhinocerous]|uniref:Major facilitator superfamily domain-containing protein 6-like n=1 Tax=Sinocyclocheilus rhinocerous TaxID=307959 RepID=A0A673LTY3_9TELE|nr:PREDICTED: major facilitator superfamily domain-containing protein 6-like [Sinocyclocheilus rhinocerous]XP_016394037.1 PREDICTED: major facilitator superfamily domain-containing protein 6-like [Sinocyclocheilus rhinocerous]XP_016394047.1 PREDICTED: major facilitator superfamily domain-containing protein 6-like [Sinocyclocheilus rhinocerous]XP_016394055.1 PREDICTED: major facilitator superfamily domain-containing protein 6-like [Sinocyclocheilus rhinocerous]XP_016394060.1 PREDICTED: major fac